MRNILLKINMFIFICFSFIAVNTLPSKAIAFWCANCANITTQLSEKAEQALQYAKQLEQYQTQLNQYKDQIKQAMSFGNPLTNSDDITKTLEKLKDTYLDSQALSFDMSNITSEFEQLYPGYNDYLQKANVENPKTQYKKWSETGFSNARVAIEAAGINTSSFENESQTLDRLIEKSASAEGRMQAIQAGNEIAGQQIKQIQLMRDLMANNTTLQANYIAEQTEKEAVDNAAVEKFFEAEPVNTGRNKAY